MKLTRARSIGLFLFAIIAALAVLMFAPIGMSIKEVNRITIGMSHDEVLTVLAGRLPSREMGLFQEWDVADGCIGVAYDRDKRVRETWTHYVPRWKKWMNKVQKITGL